MSADPRERAAAAGAPALIDDEDWRWPILNPGEREKAMAAAVLEAAYRAGCIAFVDPDRYYQEADEI